MLRLIAAAAALAVSLIGAADASNLSNAQARKVLPSTDARTLAPVLRNAGYYPEIIEMEGRESIAIRHEGDVIMLRPRVCNPNCTGLLMVVVMEGSAPSQAINAYNQQTPATMAYTFSGATILSRYLIADHGITAGTFLVNLDVFNKTVRKWTQNRNSRNAMSVSLLSSLTPDDIDRDTEAFITAVRKRGELISGRVAADY
ncbi:YbjN domain-containing protein [Parvularcula maris]|uniref:YbjN domain-containing protein n=1 Tax=Parvularcula maris TaxID=2965077 RepID=A0A9X2L959_9PROT|nr:YbjN domain-containing protein [Parvularcula maris]MCQ8185365.1 YbjN domain-containing protein [Parvularcula maris]